jgi:5S rRNA maturation endonuclease (ribonuclease M5)
MKLVLLAAAISSLFASIAPDASLNTKKTHNTIKCYGDKQRYSFVTADNIDNVFNKNHTKIISCKKDTEKCAFQISNNNIRRKALLHFRCMKKNLCTENYQDYLLRADISDFDLKRATVIECCDSELCDTLEKFPKIDKIRKYLKTNAKLPKQHNKLCANYTDNYHTIRLKDNFVNFEYHHFKHRDIIANISAGYRTKGVFAFVDIDRNGQWERKKVNALKNKIIVKTDDKDKIIIKKFVDDELKNKNPIYLATKNGDNILIQNDPIIYTIYTWQRLGYTGTTWGAYTSVEAYNANKFDEMIVLFHFDRNGTLVINNTARPDLIDTSKVFYVTPNAMHICNFTKPAKNFILQHFVRTTSGRFNQSQALNILGKDGYEVDNRTTVVPTSENIKSTDAFITETTAQEEYNTTKNVGYSNIYNIPFANAIITAILIFINLDDIANSNIR